MGPGKYRHEKRFELLYDVLRQIQLKDDCPDHRVDRTVGVGDEARKDELWLYQKVGSQFRDDVHTLRTYVPTQVRGTTRSGRRPHWDPPDPCPGHPDLS